MIQQLLEYDKELFLFLNNLGSERWDTLWLVITNKLTFIPMYAALLFLIYKKIGWQRLLIVVLVITALITFTDQITNVFKRGFMRPRPCGAEDLVDYVRFIGPRCGKYGFFSGHSSNTMAVAVFAGLILRPYFKKIIFFLLLWSAIVAYSRIYVGVHYPIDIICGMAFGVLSGFSFYKLYAVLAKRFIRS